MRNIVDDVGEIIAKTTDDRTLIGGLRNPLEHLHVATIMAVVTGSESPSRAIATLPLPYCH